MALLDSQEVANDPPSPDAVRLVIETMYQVAANPEAWERLIDVLDEDGLGRDPDPEILRGLALSEDIARLASRPDEGPTTTRRSDIGWLLLNPRGKVIAHNGAVLAALGGAVSRLEIGQPVVFRDPDNTEALAAALARARARQRGQIILKLERGDDDGPGFAYVLPARSLPGLTDLPALAAEDESFAVVFPAAAEAGRLWSSLSESFGLTPAEVRLARKLRDGRSLQDAADELSVSVNTVRNQLRAIFDKMGLKRQSDLIRALTELSALAGLIEADDPVRAQEEAIAQAPPLRFVSLADGRRLAYREYGDPAGRAVLTFHEGLGSSLLPPETEALARRLGLRIVSAERPGFGQSDPRPDYSFDGVAHDMVELCDQLGLERLQIGAALSGTPSAIQTAIALGERAERVLIYSGRPPRGVPEPTRNPLTMMRSRIEANPWLMETFLAVLRLRLSPAMMIRVMQRSSAQSPGDQAYLAAHPEAATYVAAYMTEALARSSRGPADELRAFRRGRNMSVSGLKAPLIVWHGEQDRLAPLPQLLAFLGEHASEVRVRPGVGHFMILRYWDDIMRELAAVQA
ncbi:pimeloyl-ACP methyl ester carboxylesterase/DNA-binding CsgD family transcriptional regulator [Phenylobacterium haematophilum]|uniref:Pimeloyl-ACP methyl ester carboxylesterase/DNA-binding CsgD family transcriptional regulator n=1 Tax=Phenylobacterium haematophilum TaxID=98513 RepID=A0A839ZZC3_9CAUL|nr:alpha/beta fold hydrolase [Phenylobacterium haematophilum]MBB3891498.1 pimeloyl-ACP methyl ester carboxylesterase/DNA-binding CsgD family transcriptional regulator [Phenylobacterium haematophilum]